MTSATNGQPQPTAPKNWLFPLIVCGAAPSLLFLLASLVLLVVWLFRGEPAEPAARQPMTPQSESVEPPTTESSGEEGGVSSEDANRDSVATDSEPRRVRFPILPKPDNVNLPITRATDYAYDHNTGRLAIVGPWKNAIGFVSVDEQPVGGAIRDVELVELRGEPHALTCHVLASGDGVFAIAQTKATGIILIDAGSLEIVKSLRLDNWPTFVWATGKSTPQYLYFTMQTSRGLSFLATGGDDAGVPPQGWEVKMQRIDLAGMELDRRFQGEEFNTARLREVRGRLVGNFMDVVVVDLDRRFAAYQDRVYSARDGKKLTDLDFQAKRFLSQGPWLAGVAESEIVVGSINDGRIVAGVSLPDVYEKMLGRVMEEGRGHVFAKVFLDLKRKYLVVGRLQHVIIIPIETLGLPEEPIVLLDESPPTTVEKGALYEFPLRTVSGEGSFALVEGPEGMVIKDSVVRWRPETAYTGPVEVKVKTTAGEIAREELWHVTVE